MLLTKSKAAFLMTAHKLFECAARKRASCYFWTFTFKRVLHDWEYPERWHKFIRELSDMHAGMCGVRVVEPHKRHGLHYHCIIDVRVSRHVVCAIGKKYGIGFVWVERCDMGTAHYLSKYLGKESRRMLSLTGRRLRKWGTIGGFQGVRYKDIVVDSAYMRARRRIVKERLPFGYEELLRRSFEVGNESNLARCYSLLVQGKRASACRCVDRRLFLTPKNGLVLRPKIRFSVAIGQRSKPPTIPRLRGRPSKYCVGPF